ncbi:MAG: hypothetical protein ABL959_14815 [Pyrinomonadaceae bacterium]
MEKTRKILEIASNIAIVVAAALLGYFLISRFNTSPTAPPVQAA